MSVDSQKLIDGTPWKLVPLTPEYSEVEHGGYVSAIDAALSNPKILNIALSGNYGVGKSSILQEVARRHKDRVVDISLSTLAPIDVSNMDESVPKQATTPTNRIQQEIVKQLLYREEPHKMPGSRFRRIERFRKLREFGIASLVGLVVMVIFLLTGWTDKLSNSLTPTLYLGLWEHILVFSFSVGLTISIRSLVHGQIHIRQLSAGAATVTLDDKSMSYFDQYLDEIVYFFEVSGRDIVVFEDIDRFNDSLIFETLRALNTLLNFSPQISKSVRFIYAIKDSIFDQSGLKKEKRKIENELLAIGDPAQAEVVRANRTKFFDLVIPVVPFITHRSARNLAVQLLSEIDHKIDPNLIDLASRYVPDMRLLKNVRNEFVVFRNRIFSGDGEQLNLSETELFAMMLYKSTHLADFESIRIGKSNLDTLYETSRKLVVTSIRELEHKIFTINQRLTQLESVTKQNLVLGTKLLAHVQRTARAAGYAHQNGSFTLENRSGINDNEIKSVDFWVEFVTLPDEPVLHWRNRNGHYLSFHRSDIASALEVRLDPVYWNKADRDGLEADLELSIQQLKFLRSADMGSLIKRQEFLVGGESKQTLEVIARNLLKDGLAFQLVRANFINRNFTLYTSTFHGDRVSPAATNFIIHHVERDSMDEYFVLEGNDAEAVIRECGKKSLSDASLYNISILDHLLFTDIDSANLMVHSVINFGVPQMRFLQAYLNNGRELERFICCFTNATSKALVYIIKQVELLESLRLNLVNTALVNLDPEVDYQVDSSVSEYLSAHYAELPALTAMSENDSNIEQIVIIFSKAGIKLPALEPLSVSARRQFVANNLYVICRDNLVIALGDDSSLALDAVRKITKAVYGYTMQNLVAYLSAIDGTSATIDSEQDFIIVIKDVLAAAPSHLSEVIEHASESCVVNELNELPTDTWPILANYVRFPATFKNVSDYINLIGSLDANLAKVLARDCQITDHSSFDPDDKETVALSILAARKHLPAASLRLKLVLSLDLERKLAAAKIAAETGELFGLLLKHKVIEDTAVTYTHLLGTDWPTRELVILESTQFINYITPSLLNGDLAQLLSSDHIPVKTKVSIVERASTFIDGCTKKDLTQLAIFSIKNRLPIEFDVVMAMASHGVSAEYVVVLLEPLLQLVTRTQLLSVLQNTVGEYNKLTFLGNDKPRISNTSANVALLNTLKIHGIVSSYTIEASSIKVNKKLK